jgi:hypothetical protein
MCLVEVSVKVAGGTWPQRRLQNEQNSADGMNIIACLACRLYHLPSLCQPIGCVNKRHF